MLVKASWIQLVRNAGRSRGGVNECILSMCRHLDIHGFSFDDNDFLESYRTTVLWYRTIINEGLREVNNRIGFCDTLNRMYYNVKAPRGSRRRILGHAPVQQIIA